MIHQRTLQALLEARLPEDYTPSEITRDFRRAFLGSDEGKRVLAVLLHQCGFMAATVPNGQRDQPYAHVFNDGRRSVAEFVATVIDRDLTEPGELKVEHVRSRSRTRTRGASTSPDGASGDRPGTGTGRTSTIPKR